MTSQKLVSVGPNLPRELADLGTLHYHAEGCAHLNRGALRQAHEDEKRWGGGQAIEFASIREAVLEAYPPSDFEYDADTDEYNGYRDDLYFAPCVTLPEVAE